ncbi:MAG: AbrB/MazE/SpoVT family DNA-binding domain-containing protein [Lachnospiraceae bacterium]|nr:AbrB/MazE/SpoVT family DNA-binding domain-containing protein [Lachnospiraceae bacterium]
MLQNADIVLDRRTVSISSKRQITIPQKFFAELDFHDRAECILLEDELIIRPANHTDSGEFADLILEDLINEGYSGKALLAEFRKRQSRVRPAVEKMIREADQAAHGEGEFYTFEEVFGEED